MAWWSDWEWSLLVVGLLWPSLPALSMRIGTSCYSLASYISNCWLWVCAFRLLSLVCSRLANLETDLRATKPSLYRSALASKQENLLVRGHCLFWAESLSKLYHRPEQAWHLNWPRLSLSGAKLQVSCLWCFARSCFVLTLQVAAWFSGHLKQSQNYQCANCGASDQLRLW